MLDLLSESPTPQECVHCTIDAVHREVVCEAVLQQRMQQYCDSLEKFERVTTVDVYLEAVEASDVLASVFTKMTVRINKPVSQCTLHEIRKDNRSNHRKNVSSPHQIMANIF